MADWEPINGELTWQSPMLFTAEVSRAQLLARFGTTQFTDVQINGVIPFHAWLIRFLCGLEIAIWSFDYPYWRPRAPEDRDYIELHASQLDRDHLLFHLNLSPEAICETEPAQMTTGPLTHQVLRLDDNGNQFEVTRVSSACQANAIAQSYEALGHKQTYWVREVEAD